MRKRNLLLLTALFFVIVFPQLVLTEECPFIQSCWAQCNLHGYDLRGCFPACPSGSFSIEDEVEITIDGKTVHHTCCYETDPKLVCCCKEKPVNEPEPPPETVSPEQKEAVETIKASQPRVIETITLTNCVSWFCGDGEKSLCFRHLDCIKNIKLPSKKFRIYWNANGKIPERLDLSIYVDDSPVSFGSGLYNWEVNADFHTSTGLIGEGEKRTFSLPWNAGTDVGILVAPILIKYGNPGTRESPNWRCQGLTCEDPGYPIPTIKIEFLEEPKSKGSAENWCTKNTAYAELCYGSTLLVCRYGDIKYYYGSEKCIGNPGGKTTLITPGLTTDPWAPFITYWGEGKCPQKVLKRTLPEFGPEERGWINTFEPELELNINAGNFPSGTEFFIDFWGITPYIKYGTIVVEGIEALEEQMDGRLIWKVGSGTSFQGKIKLKMTVRNFDYPFTIRFWGESGGKIVKSVSIPLYLGAVNSVYTKIDPDWTKFCGKFGEEPVTVKFEGPTHVEAPEEVAEEEGVPPTEAGPAHLNCVDLKGVWKDSCEEGEIDVTNRAADKETHQDKKCCVALGDLSDCSNKDGSELLDIPCKCGDKVCGIDATSFYCWENCVFTYAWDKPKEEKSDSLCVVSGEEWRMDYCCKNEGDSPECCQSIITFDDSDAVACWCENVKEGIDEFKKCIAESELTNVENDKCVGGYKKVIDGKVSNEQCIPQRVEKKLSVRASGSYSYDSATGDLILNFEVKNILDEEVEGNILIEICHDDNCVSDSATISLDPGDATTLPLTFRITSLELDDGSFNFDARFYINGELMSEKESILSLSVKDGQIETGSININNDYFGAYLSWEEITQSIEKGWNLVSNVKSMKGCKIYHRAFHWIGKNWEIVGVSNMELNKGYWIYAFKDCTVDIIPEDVDIHLTSGWNQIAGDGVTTVNDLPDNCQEVWYYTKGDWVSLESTDKLEIGKAYWVRCE